MVYKKKDIIDVKQALSISNHETPKLFSLSACPLHQCFQNFNVQGNHVGCTIFFNGKGWDQDSTFLARMLLVLRGTTL